jgi:hypothetical protein
LQTPVTPYPAGPAKASILRPKRHFPSGGYLRPKGRFPPGGYLRPKGRFPSYARGQPEPGKREWTLQKTQNNHPVHQEREARLLTVLHTLPHEGEDAPNPGGKGQAERKGGGREDPGPGDPTAGETRRFTAIGQRVRQNPKNPGHGAKVGLPHCRPWEKPQPKGGCSACPWKCHTCTRWAMALCPISGSGEDPRRGGEEGNSPPAKTTGSPRTKGGVIEGGARTQSPQANQRVCQGYAQATLIPIYRGTTRRDRKGGTQRGHRRKGQRRERRQGVRG